MMLKGNLSNILTYYLPQPGPHRDAFVERIGRGLGGSRLAIDRFERCCIGPSSAAALASSRSVERVTGDE